ncbi:hypothetical protein [Nostoc sp.]|uniref:hypothetical protein n=1 Tax=Nostoc sp. TaxID=1180 RepID=UPI002FFB0ED8
MGHEFPEDSKTSGTKAVITVSRKVIKVSGGEQVVKFDVCNRNTFHKDLGSCKTSLAKDAMNRVSTRQIIGVVHVVYSALILT